MRLFNRQALDEALLKEPLYIEMLEHLKKEVIDFFENFHDDYNKVSQWGHHYFCKDDGGLLTFDLTKPHDHICPICGTVYQSELYDGVWVYYYRNFVALNVWKSALLYQITKENRYLKYISKMIDFYVRGYLNFKRHDKSGRIYEESEEVDWGCGRIMPQGLNESTFMIRLFNGFEIVKTELSVDELEAIKEMSDEVYKLLKPQVDKIHNIPCWNNSALVNIGLFNGNTQLVHEAFNDTYGLYEQIKLGVTKDFFWFEGSIHYNMFVLEGILNSLVFSKIYKYRINKGYLNKIEEMLLGTYQYSFDNGVLPNPNDGWPNINLKTYGYIYDMASFVFGDGSLSDNLNKNISNMKIERTELPLSKPYYYKNIISLERLTLNPNIDLQDYYVVKQKANNFKTSQFAILRNDNINVFMKYGHNGPSHAHPDKMNIEVAIKDYMLTRDLSNAGYGAKLCNEWHRMSLSHSTVVVNGRNQVSMEPGKTINGRDDYIKARAYDVYHSKDADVEKMLRRMNPDEVIKYLTRYLNFTNEEALDAIKHRQNIKELVELRNPRNRIDYERTIKLLENGFEDTFIVTSELPVNSDFVFHSEAELLTEFTLRDREVGYDSFGYQHIKGFKEVRIRRKKIDCQWRLGDLILESRIHLYGDAKLYLTKTFDNPVTKYRTTFIIRNFGTESRFRVEWKIKG